LVISALVADGMTSNRINILSNMSISVSGSEDIERIEEEEIATSNEPYI
jgi:hypothetical protein